MKKAYDISAPSFKFVRVIPGLITLILVFAPVWATLAGYPEIVLYYVAFLSVYWFYKTVLTNIGNLIAYRRYKRAISLPWDNMISKINWQELPDPEQLPNSFKDLNVVLLVPVYKEPYEVLEKTFQAITESTFDTSKITILVGLEESAGEPAVVVIEKLIQNFSRKVKAIKYYIHPRGIPGEAIGIAGPNLNWASRKFTAELIEKGEDLKNYLIMKFDSDTRIDKNFVSSFVHTYLVSPNRYYSFFSPAIILYSNNYWDVPVLIRVFSGVLTLALMSEWVIAKKNKQSFSCFGFSLQLLHDIDYFDPIIGVDDTGFYWRAYLTLDGKFKGEEFYTPIRMDATEAETYAKTHIVAYKQLKRWGWGAIVYPMALQSFAKNKKISFWTKFLNVLEFFRIYNLFSTVAFLLTFSIPIISYLNPDFGLSSSAHVLPNIISIILTFTLIGLFPSRSVLEGLYGSPPIKYGVLFFLWHYFEQILLTVFSLTLGFFPYLQAQVEMMLGRSMTFIVTPKMTRKE